MSAASSFPSVSVILVNYNVRDYLVHCIQSLKQSNYDGFLEILVVDNHSFDDSVATIRTQFPEVKIQAQDTNLGFGKAVNRGVADTSGDYLFILNPDTVVQEDTLASLVTYMEAHPEVGIVGPKILNADGSLQLACKRTFPTLSVALPKVLGLSRLFPRTKWAGRYNLTYLDEDEIHSVDAISGSCMLVRRSVFEAVDGFDERFFMYGEDLDLCYRVKAQGYSIHYYPRTQIVHYQGESVKSAPFDSIHAFYQAMIIFSQKHFSRSYSFLLRKIIATGVYVRKWVSLLGEWKTQILSIVLDGLAVLIAFLLAIPLRFDDFEPIVSSSGLVPGVYVLFWIGMNALFQLYSRYLFSYSRAVLSSLTGFFLAVTFTYFFKQYAFSRLVILVATALITIMIPGWRMVVQALIGKGYFRPVGERHTVLFRRKTLIMGTDEECRRITQHILKRFDTGLDIVGCCDRKRPEQMDQLPVPFLGFVDDLRAIVKKYHIRELIFPTQSFSYQEIVHIMDLTKELKLTYRMVPRHRDILLGQASIEEIGDYSFVNIDYPLYYRFHLLTKRLFDILVSGGGLLLFSPVLLIASLSGKLTPVRFWGENHSTFRAYLLNSRYPILRFLPLLWNVFLGRISLVGSRLVPESEPDPHPVCRPGITGLDRIRTVDLDDQEKEALDRYYLQNQTFTLDLEILVKSLVR
ncbi:MAG: glycosyltransferase [Candidatus Neomarinimicrobiota bacterium]|nr:MAG: glycosyltransferase [Candidatus Neomarinimicrobiota bacterium]